MTKFFSSLAVMGLLASWVAVAAAIPPQHHGGHHAEYHQGGPGGAGLNYDPASEITVKGTVDRIWTEDCLCCACDGATHFTLEANGTTYEAHVGPTCYLLEKGWEIMKGDSLEITGAVLPYRGEGKGLVVREIRRGEERLLLRDENGVPLWSARPCR